MRGINIVAKKESSTKSFVLRVDAETMDAIEKWAADDKWSASMDYCRSLEKEWADERNERSK